MRDPARIPAVLARYCIDCDAVLSMGPANDEPLAVRAEIRVVDLVVDPNDVARFSIVEWAGYWDEETYSVGRCEPLRSFDLTRVPWLAGYLARAIDFHEAEVDHA
jgi:hypothetical protein